MKTVVVACVLALVAACTRPAGGGPASQAAGATVEVGPCREDAARLCPDLRMAGGTLPACLRQKAWDLSPPCHEYLPTLEKAYWDARDAK
jgi:hypothetical protein